MRSFETVFLEEANVFMSELEPGVVRKILYNIDLAKQTNDMALFKKLQKDIWEFRTRYAGIQIRMLAFWDKAGNKRTLVVATHGFIKKSKKVPKNEIAKAIKLRKEYYKNISREK